MALSKPRTGHGKTLNGQSREIIFNVFNYFRVNYKDGDGQQPNMIALYNLTKTATGTSKSSVQRIVTGALKQVAPSVVSSKTSAEPGPSRGLVFSTPGKKRSKPAPKSDIDDFDVEVIRRTIYNFHLEFKKTLTIKSLLEVLREKIDFNGGVSTLRKIVRKLGFRWKKTGTNRKILIERHNIRLKRTLFLEKLRKYREEGRVIVYTDESYIHSTHTKPNAWCDGTNKGLRQPISKGDRAIIVHACMENGFVPNALLLYTASQKTGDYHDNMNAANYQKWLREMLIPNLPPNSVLVMDNAGYHNVQIDPAPTMSHKKSEMLAWLQKRKIPFPEKNTKPVLLEIIKLHKPSHEKFVMDQIMEEYGHSALRLPPYHPELNPIETLWGIIKGRVAAKNVDFTLTSVKKLVQEEASAITEETFRKVFRKTRDYESGFEALEPKLDDLTDSEFIVNVGGEKDVSDSTSSSDSDMSGIEELSDDADV